MTKYIECEVALEALCAPCNTTVGNEICPYRFTRCSQYYDIYNLPAADVKPVVRGEWIDEPIYKQTMSGKTYDGFTYCSHCRTDFDFGYRTNFCPNCGADMRKGE